MTDDELSLADIERMWWEARDWSLSSLAHCSACKARLGEECAFCGTCQQFLCDFCHAAHPCVHYWPLGGV